MYKTGLVLKNSDLLAQITALHIWGENTGFEIEAVWVDVKSLTDVWKKKCFDLLIVEASLVGSKEYQIFREIKKSQCSHIVFCGQNGNFESARIGILLGIDDYWTLPFDQKTIRSLFQRIQSENVKTIDSIEKYANELLGLFLRQEAELYNYTEHLCRLHLFSEAADQVVQAVFEQNDWLDLYLNEQEFLSPEVIDVEEHKNKLKQLFDEFLLLNPRHNESLDSIIQYILYNPESDLRQKSLSEEQHINKSYLSTLFTAQTGIRFVDYVTYVKLMRAAWLLKNSDMKINEIAGRIDYKDIAYFSKQFKKIFHMTPSEYRLPDDYQFQI